MAYTTQVKLLDAITVDTTGEAFEVGDRVKLSLQFVAASVSGGSGAFTVEVSNDGSNWVAYNRLTSNVTNTNGQNDTRVAAPTLSSNTTSIYFVPEGDHFAYIRASVDVTTNGVYSVILHSVV